MHLMHKGRIIRKICLQDYNFNISQLSSLLLRSR